MRPRHPAILFLLLCAALLCLAQEAPPPTAFPPAEWRERPDPAAAPDAARPGGEFTEYLGPSPKSLNYYLDNSTISSQVMGLLYETLLSIDSRTLEYTPALACRWTISADQREFTFWLDPNARWSDGVPVTAEDVLWTYQALVDPHNLTGPFRFAMERLEEPVILPDGGIRFRARDIHWENLATVGGFHILPKHAYGAQDFNLLNFEFPVVSGPYRIATLREGEYLLLEKRADWWRADYPASQGLYNFEHLKMRFFEDSQNAFEAFKKGEIDQMTIYSAAQWYKLEERLASLRNNWIVKQAVYNHQPVGMQGFAFNMRRPLFQDVRVRRALAHLLNRPFMNDAMMFGQYFLHRSYWEDLYDEAHPCANPEYGYDTGEARRLLTEAGWKINPQSGLLEKDGQPFKFEFLSRGGNDKFIAVFNEALKDVGITMAIVSKDWSAWAKDMDDFNFDMTWAAWGGGLFKDPEQLWSSREAANKGSSNITGFADPEVDRLIDLQKTEFDTAKRNEILRQIDRRLCEQCPYILLWNLNYTRTLYWNRFGRPATLFGKYGGDSGDLFWWSDRDREDELRYCMETNSPMPPEPATVTWDKLLPESKAP